MTYARSQPANGAEARRTVTESLRRYLTAHKDADIIAAADGIIELRKSYPSPVDERQPDWAGRGWQYRQDVADIYSEVGLGADHPERGRILSLLRYHVGNTIRLRAPTDELEAQGLGSLGPRERHHEARNAAFRIAEKVTGRGSDPAKTVATARFLLDSIQPTVTLDAVDEAQTREMAEAIKRWAETWLRSR